VVKLGAEGIFKVEVVIMGMAGGLLACLALLGATHVDAIKWLAVSQVSSIASSSRDPQLCDQMKGSLIKKQVKFCKRNPGFMDSVRLGAVRAIDECQYQFRARRWNCSSLQDSLDQQVSLIKAHLGERLGPSSMVGGKMASLPALATSSLYPQAPSMHGSMPRMSEANLNAMFNSYPNYGARNARDNKFSNKGMKGRGSREGRKSRNVRRGRRTSRSRKARRGTDSALADVSPEQELLVRSNNVTVSGTEVGGVGNKQLMRNKGNGKRKAKDVAAEWQAALGPYPVVSPGTREASFVHAISSAGVAHAVTRSCSSGELENCGCDRSLRGMSPEGFQWSGCSDNVDFGVTFSRTFVDAQDRRKSRKRPKNPISLMNLHNNEAGRKLLERNMKVECKCHGVSGSCELKTCWRSLASFRMIGAMLKEKFDGAHEVKQKRRSGRRMLVPKYHRFKHHGDIDLVYLVTSPDYCELDVKKGSLGTKGRECNPKSKGIDGCDLLCCNRGYTTRRERRTERCKCKFHWCCYVECEECVRDVQISTCN